MIANRVIGTVVGTYPHPIALPRIVYDVSDVIIHNLLRLPVLLFIRLHDVQITLIEGFPEGVIGVPPLHGGIRLGNIPNLS